jgi:hypothetical protein
MSLVQKTDILMSTYFQVDVFLFKSASQTLVGRTCRIPLHLKISYGENYQDPLTTNLAGELMPYTAFTDRNADTSLG